jgi:hypothetical protein
VVNQYLHSDGRGYQEFAQYRRVRGRVDLGFANVRDDRIDTRTQDAGIDVIGLRSQMNHDVNWEGSNQLPQKQSFFQQPSGVRRKVMGEKAGIRKTPPSLGARRLFRFSSV